MMFNGAKRLVVSAVVLMGVALGAVTLATPAQAAGLQLPSSYTCKSGFVWREATTHDPVCVTPAVRSAARADNAAAASRVANWANRWCKSGFVWRETRPSDLVCVTPATRSQAADDNKAQLQRLADPAATGYGGASVNEYLHQLGGYLYGAAFHMTPYSTIRFGATVPNGVMPAGSLVTDGSGNAPMQFIASLPCRFGLPGGSVVVALDTRTGIVSNAGATGILTHCGW